MHTSKIQISEQEWDPLQRHLSQCDSTTVPRHIGHLHYSNLEFDSLVLEEYNNCH